ncbi:MULTISPECIES: TlyA family RNA methyltransferase [unclassified Halanaerobium]|uniref:TlyA family RNA methyltransferase n=1 Tax=unclassified Halanaerobium TaxID=2641197 RepID=UPI000DF2D06D|nr:MULTISPECIES: TlyA family RNA methyltransferase [unclassified Halanaerobium]RCW50553.1 23S rRNA (cytidine1920-2'-O)/16S rRNA (cytidine1409-2'-O)-methyltransferase [Halanaerobium sp. MA284_MarDTE_T2]RCW82179.1 23S rRNA (cytidine1920-2'-O)/16S rRNA (cytidine1409-2'-O)-methyltransferase [Halanaerobium sp. DL-01]
MAGKERLDILLSERGLFSSRSRAKRAVMAGIVYIDGVLVDKAGTRIKKDADIEIKGDKNPYVSRGGYKLEKALQVFAVDPAGIEAIDIGASTGGFTDCLLQNGAKKVYAVDVGYGQLAWKLRNDERVEVYERCNFRYLEFDQLPVKAPLIVTDVSFISLRLIVPGVKKFLKKPGDFIALIKPQFEAGRERVGKKGVVKDPAVHRDVILSLSGFFMSEGFKLKGLNYSPITGAESSNIEYLIHLKYTTNNADNIEETASTNNTYDNIVSDKDSTFANKFNNKEWKYHVEKIVSKAHKELGR